MPIVPLLCVTLLGCYGSGEAMEGSSRQVLEAEFWGAVALCSAEWTEDFDRVDAMADAADAVVLGKVVGVTAGNTVDDGSGWLYVEVNLLLAIDESLRGGASGTIEVSLTAQGAGSAEEQASAVAYLEERIPQGPHLAILRLRGDIEGLYRFVHPKGLWTGAGNTLSNPLVGSCQSPQQDAELLQFLDGLQSMDELTQRMREQR